MGFGNILTHLYNQLNPFFPTGNSSGIPPSAQYTCQGYAEDSKALEFMNRSIEKGIEDLKNHGIDPTNHPGILRDYALRDNIQKCLSDAGNVIFGNSNNEPNIALYAGIGVGIAAGIAGLVYYMKARGKKVGKN